MKGVRVFRVNGARSAGEALAEDPRLGVVVITEVEAHPMGGAVGADPMVEVEAVAAGKDSYFTKVGGPKGSVILALKIPVSCSLL